MRHLILITLAIGIAAAAAPSSAQTYDPNYPVCKQLNSDASSIDCLYTTMEQCKEDVRGMSAVCVVNPFYKSPPTPAAAAPARPAH